MPLVLVGIAIFQVLANRGHVDNNVVGALVFIAVGGTAGYAIDRIIQNLYWARTTGGVDREHPGRDAELSGPQVRPSVVPGGRRKRKRNFEPVRETPEAVTEED